jgi:hypothetical protein
MCIVYNLDSRNTHPYNALLEPEYPYGSATWLRDCTLHPCHNLIPFQSPPSLSPTELHAAPILFSDTKSQPSPPYRVVQRERERERSWRLPRTSPHDMLQGFSMTGTIFLSVFPYSPLVSDTQENFYFQRSDA